MLLCNWRVNLKNNHAKTLQEYQAPCVRSDAAAPSLQKWTSHLFFSHLLLLQWESVIAHLVAQSRTESITF